MKLLKLIAVLLDYPDEALWAHGDELRAATQDPALSPERRAALLGFVETLLASEPMAAQEIDRYTFWMPGQAPSYYYGLMKLQALRAQTELALGDRFDQLAFHDFILQQGLLPLDLLQQAVVDDFVPARLKDR